MVDSSPRFAPLPPTIASCDRSTSRKPSTYVLMLPPRWSKHPRDSQFFFLAIDFLPSSVLLRGILKAPFASAQHSRARGPCATSLLTAAPSNVLRTRAVATSAAGGAILSMSSPAAGVNDDASREAQGLAVVGVIALDHLIALLIVSSSYADVTRGRVLSAAATAA